MDNPETSIAVRTLLSAGFTITNSERHARHIEIDCSRADILGISVQYRIALFDGDTPPVSEPAKIAAAAMRDGRVAISVARTSGDGWIGWIELLDGLGGAVPNWRALGPSYRDILLTTAQNVSPPNSEGEAWLQFEEATADGFEFLLGARVNRLGGKRRGKKVSDLVTQLPDKRILVVDTKAYSSPFDASSGNLRALKEYTERQIQRQRGQIDVAGAVLVANAFAQDKDGLQRVASDFLAETRVPVTFVEAVTIANTVECLSMNPVLRSAVRWSHLYCRGGLVEWKLVQTEINDAAAERMRG